MVEETEICHVEDRIITLQVGERHFTTTKETLTESRHLSALVNGPWKGDMLADGAYFIDTDGELFEHILRYLRRGVLPIFFDNEKGHDHALYFALLEEARFFLIDRLEKWLVNKKYLEAVSIQRIVDEDDGEEDGEDEVFISDLNSGSDIDMEVHSSFGIAKIYVCPRSIPCHRGRPDRCGRVCKNAQGAVTLYDDEPLCKLVIVKKKTEFDMDVCLEGRE